MLAQGRSISSTSTGVFTVECALALVEKAVLASGTGLHMDFRFERCFDTWVSNPKLLLFII